ncbi:NAD-dependent succinate-semialdehyde dehydrogenase [bacterium]|nr:NAD-dependent succinate-semialdehyde dehydrogenase [bacterium]
MAFQSINPSTDALIKNYSPTSWKDALSLVDKTTHAFQKWTETSYQSRANHLKKMAEVLRARKKSLAELMASEMGKPILQGIAEIEKCAWVCEYYADHGEKFLSPESVPSDGQKSYITYKPLGIILAIMPWNFPFWQVIRFLAPTVLAGNGALLKHAPNVSGCAMAIKQVFDDSGFPQELFNVVFLEPEHISQLIEHPLIQGVTLTGSVKAGQAVASHAGKFLKKTVMELGGSDAYIVLEDADIELAAETCVNSRLINTGQSCIAAKRFLVVEAVHERFEELLIEKMRKKTIGNPLEGQFDLGPLARKDLRDTLHRQVEESIRQGAKLKLGGQIPQGSGAFYPPTVLSGVKPGMTVFEEETFGPVASVISIKNESEAVQLANKTSFGLGGAVFTTDLERGEKIARDYIQAGSCFVNAFVKSDPRLPFGGIKQSGYGRELSAFGIREFVNIKTVYIK